MKYKKPKSKEYLKFFQTILVSRHLTTGALNLKKQEAIHVLLENILPLHTFQVKTMYEVVGEKGFRDTHTLVTTSNTIKKKLVKNISYCRVIISNV